MSRPSTIPTPLHRAIVNRWTLGHSPGQIAAWLGSPERPPHLRFRTSRSSVNRLLERLLGERGEQCRLSAVQRLRVRSRFTQDACEAVGDEMRDCLRRGRTEPYSPQEMARLRFEMMGLSRLSMHLHRQLRAAGTTGPSGDRVVESWENVTKGMRETVDTEGAAACAPVRIEAPIPAASPAIVADTPPAPDATAVRQAFEAGRAGAPLVVEVPREQPDMGPAPDAEALPLTAREQAYCAGYAEAWAQRAPGDDGLLARTEAELRYQKHAVQARQLLRDTRAGVRNGDAHLEPETVVEAVTLAPEVAVPAPYGEDPPQRRAWRDGEAGLLAELTTEWDEATVHMLGDVPLTPVDLAWCAGAVARGLRAPPPTNVDPPPAPLTADELWEFEMEQLRVEKWRARAADRPTDPPERIDPDDSEVWQEVVH